MTGDKMQNKFRSYDQLQKYAQLWRDANPDKTVLVNWPYDTSVVGFQRCAARLQFYRADVDLETVMKIKGLK